MKSSQLFEMHVDDQMSDSSKKGGSPRLRHILKQLEPHQIICAFMLPVLQYTPRRMRVNIIISSICDKYVYGDFNRCLHSYVHRSIILPFSVRVSCSKFYFCTLLYHFFYSEFRRLNLMLIIITNNLILWNFYTLPFDNLANGIYSAVILNIRVILSIIERVSIRD